MLDWNGAPRSPVATFPQLRLSTPEVATDRVENPERMRLLDTVGYEN